MISPKRFDLIWEQLLMNIVPKFFNFILLILSQLQLKAETNCFFKY